MYVDIKTNKNFETALNKLKEKYGEEFEYLNGFHDTQMNFSDFTNSFSENNVADTTIDGNANAYHKDIVSLRTEKNKPSDKLFSFSKIFYEINKKYGLKVAREWLDAEYSGAFYLHDAPSSSQVPYSYKGTETIVVKYRGNLLLTTFADLYDLVEGEVELLSEEDSAYCKYTDDLFVWDTNDTWTKVIRVIQKPKKHNFHFIKANNGMSEIVTSNHPVITTNGDKLASDVTEDDFVHTEAFNADLFGDVNTISCLKVLLDTHATNRSILFRGEPVYNATDELMSRQGQICYFNATNPIDNIINLDYDFGWLVGMIVADGYYSGDNICIVQNRGSILNKIIDVCEERHFGYILNHKSSDCTCIKIRSNVLADVIYNAFICKSGSLDIHLQPDILKYNKEFIKGIIGGVLDGDGTLTHAQGRRIHIRVTSRALINQLAFIIRCFGYTVREQCPTAPNPDMNAFIKQKNYIYHLAFTPYNDVENFKSIKIAEHSIEYTSKSLEGRYTNGKYTFGYGEKQISNNIELTYDNDEFVYDISVETGHFMCNNILSHNCYAYDLTRLATEGLFFLSNYNNEPPQHLTTYFDDVVEYVSFFCNRSSGAVGLPNLLVWSFYYWKKDIKNDYYIKNPDYYLRQNFQKFIYRLNQPFLRIDQSSFTNVSIFDSYYAEALFGGIEFPDGTLFIDCVDEFLEHEKVFMEVVSEVRNSNMFTFPVLSYSLLKRNDITQEEIEEMLRTRDFHIFKDNKFARWCSDHNVDWNDSNFFLSDNVGTLSNCCRLLSDTTKLDAFINSIGGTALSIGSVKVNTINLQRIFYEVGNNEKAYLKRLRERTELCCKVLDRIRHIIKRNIEKGWLPNYCDGGIELAKQYCTVGCLGLYEVIKSFGYTQTDEFGYISYTDEGLAFAQKIFDVMNEVKDNFTTEYSFNIESVPAERAAVILCSKDNLLYRPETDMFIYSNQWIPLTEKCTINEKLRLSSELDKMCGGGAIAHINIESNFPNKDAAWEMLNLIALKNVIYFAFNTRINVCKNHHGFVGTNTCPHCGEPVFDTYQRIVGFLVPSKAYSKERFKEFSARQWYSYSEMLGD